MVHRLQAKDLTLFEGLLLTGRRCRGPRATTTARGGHPRRDTSTPPRTAVAVKIGTVVHDVGDIDPDDAVVVNTPPVEADEWTVTNSDIFVSMNPEYPEDSTVIVVISLSTLTHTGVYSDWDSEDPIGLPADCQTLCILA